MTLLERKNTFIQLGHFLSQFASEEINKKDAVLQNDVFFDDMLKQIKKSYEFNGWFTPKNMHFAFKNLSEALTESSLEQWLSAYTINEPKPKTVAIIMAGNIPLVGFHDLLSVLISGHHALVKQSSNDKQFLPFIVSYLQKVEPKFKGCVSFTENKLEDFDAVIATGSDNTARYFDYYFGKYPHIIRKNRNSVAVLTGNESKEELEGVAEDIFRYFGLGCRNVSKIFVPNKYDFDKLFKAVYKWHSVMNLAKYANNYDYNKAIYLMSEFSILENGFLMIKEDTSYSSPIATLFYEYYDDLKQLQNTLKRDSEKIQCIVASGFTKGEIVFGETQKPKLWEYADQVDTVDFLLKLT